MTCECRVCSGKVTEFLDFGQQPLSDAFVLPDSREEEFSFQLVVGVCDTCSMVQLMEEVPRGHMFHEGYPYLSSQSTFMRRHFGELADRFLATELSGDDPFIVELGCNDGVLLAPLAARGVRHVGVEPSAGVADIAASKGVNVRKEFFEEDLAARLLAEHGPADVIYAANTLCHIPYMGSILNGVRGLLASNGVFVFEDPYWAEIVERASFDQIYDEHYFFFTANSVRRMARLHGLELVDVERLSVHGGEVRYTLAPAGRRTPSPEVAALCEWEDRQALTAPATLERFGRRTKENAEGLTALLRELSGQGRRIVGYGATAKSATVLNYAGIGPDLIPFVVDSTPTKQGRLTPGSGIPVRESSAFADPYPDYAVLFAWNHAKEIMEKEKSFRESGGRWILYVPEVRIA
ncbi:class I SAM-dependent methyltransferase [Nocardiopsis dassonvillei]